MPAVQHEATFSATELNALLTGLLALKKAAGALVCRSTGQVSPERWPTPLMRWSS
jgi:hypothetical protein